MIQELENKLLQAMQESDVATLDALLSDELIFTNHHGDILNKTQDLAIYRSGQSKFSDLKVNEQEIFEFDENFVVSSKVELGHYHYRFTHVWTKNGLGNYQIICANSSMVGN